ncbi:MAG: hypothetical protein WKF75_05130 [Singulisphaera sp.]
MSKRRHVPFRPVVVALEDRRLLAVMGDITATGVGQRADESFDFVGTSELYPAPRLVTGARVGNDYQDIRIALTGLNYGEQVTKIEVHYGAKGHTWDYYFDTDQQRFEGNAYLDRPFDTYTTANLFLEPWHDMDAGATIDWVKVYYNASKELKDTSASSTLATAVNKNKRVSGREVGATWTSQLSANTDLTGRGLTVGPDGNKDVKLEVTNLSRHRTAPVLRTSPPVKRRLGSRSSRPMPVGDVRDASGRLLLDQPGARGPGISRGGDTRASIKTTATAIDRRPMPIPSRTAC